MSAAPFDQRDGWIWYDGQFVPWSDAKAHVLTHGLHYGSSGIRGRARLRGRDFQVDAAFGAADEIGEILDFEIPYTVAEIDAAKPRSLQKNGYTDAYIRPVAWRGSEMMGVFGPAQQDPPGDRRLGMAELFRPGAEDEGHPPRHRRLPPP